MARKIVKKPDPNNMQEFVMWTVEEISTLKNDVKWIKYILYVVLALLATLLGLKI